jgi:hypothetical protein
MPNTDLEPGSGFDGLKSYGNISTKIEQGIENKVGRKAVTLLEACHNPVL